MEEIKLSLIEINEGQIEGLPSNPRTITQEKLDLLKKDIQDYPELLQYRGLLVCPHGKKYVTVGGNMRLRALQELGYKTAPCIVLPKEADIEKLKAYTILDNNGFGKWDWDLLANEWDDDLLKDWGMDLNFDFRDFGKFGNDNKELGGSEDKEVFADNIIITIPNELYDRKAEIKRLLIKTLEEFKDIKID